MCDLIYMVICSVCNEEYMGETGKGETRNWNRVRVYQQYQHVAIVTSRSSDNGMV